MKLNDAGEVIECNIDRIASVDEEGAKEYVKSVLATNTGKGWYDSYRYKVVKLEGESLVIMVDGSMNQTMTRNSLWALLAALAGCGALVILLIVIFSKRAVKPVAESYEKQKQFITDANHELKTPLTLILADLEIAEAELGKSEWLDDIRVESEQMATLVNKLVTLSRMDEDGTKLNMAKFNLSDAIYDSASDFERAISASGRSLELFVPEKVMYNGDEAAIRQLLSILLDNARKYCDDEGEILVTLTNGHRPCISVANSFKEVKNTELDRLFDRFYRSDKARTSGSGYGIGLSIAKAIVEKHGGKIIANKLNGDKIVFRAVL